MSANHEYQYLLADYWSPYKVPFLKDPRRIRADRIYGQTVGEDARTPEEVAADYDLPVEAVYEAIHFCTHNLELVHQERAKELAALEERERESRSRWPSAVRPPQ